jgi:sugar phosphate isomerase/epimerase
MQRVSNRRDFLKAASVTGVGLGLAGLPAVPLFADDKLPQGKGAPSAEKLGWQLSCTAYSFSQLPFYKTIDAIASLGLHAVEGFSWQPLEKDASEAQTNHKMSADERKQAKKYLADKGVKLVGCYYGLPKDDECRSVFEWAKDMDIEYLVAEPPFEAFEPLDKLCQEYKMKLAIHNHAKPNPYWNPEVLLDHLKGCSSWVGVCCDTGHWVRSGLDPVEMLKKVKGHVFTFHLKDIPEVGVHDAGCVPFGTGKGDIEGILREAKRQGYRGTLGIEYEPYTAESYNNVAECVANFEKMVAKLVK